MFWSFIYIYHHSKVYDGLYAIAVRDFGKAAKLFLETVSTFTSYELMDYTEFVKVSGFIYLNFGFNQ